MANNLLEFINSRYAANAGLSLARIIPYKLGRSLSLFLADRMVYRSEQPVVQAVRVNQWVAHGMSLTKEQLDEIVTNTFRNRALAMFDLFRNMRNEQALKEMIHFGPDFDAMIERNQLRKEGTIVLLTHTGAHELVAIAAALHGMEGFALSYPLQPGGYQWHDELRERFGINAVPTTMSSLKSAVQYLKDGGTVFTGLERPLPESGYKPLFFNRPTSLPVHYVSLALRANVSVVVAAVRRKPDGSYFIVRTGFLEMVRRENRKNELVYNAEYLLSHAEQFIRDAPAQWAMFFPLWPELLGEVP